MKITSNILGLQFNMKYKQRKLKISQNMRVIKYLSLFLGMLLVLYFKIQRYAQFQYFIRIQQYQNHLRVTDSLLNQIQGSIIENWQNKQQMKKSIQYQNQKFIKNAQKSIKATKNSNFPAFYPNNEVNITKKQLQFAIKLKNATNKHQNTKIFEQQKNYYTQKYNIDKYKEQPFCIIVPSYNNANNQRYLYNIKSILQQQYTNYHIIFIDDASTDETGKKVQDFAKVHKIPEIKLKIIINENRKMALYNIHKSVKQYCKPYEILMIIDGDDELVGKQVFKLFNAQFQSKNIWLMYTNYIMMSGGLGSSKPYGSYVIENNYFRKFSIRISHLRAFYVKLLTLIKQEDLKNQKGQWFAAANDIAIYMPIMQMSKNRMQYLPQICYLYNQNTGLNNHITKFNQQKDNQKLIKSKPSYTQVKQLFDNNQKLQLINSLTQKIQIQSLNINYG